MNTTNDDKLSLKREKREAQVFDDRAKSAIEYVFKLMMNISMSAIALSFIAITRKIEPVLTTSQQLCLLIAIGLFSISVAGGFSYAYVHYKKNQRRARALREEAEEYKEDYEKEECRTAII